MPDDLESVADSAGERPRVYNRHPGRKDAAEIRALEQKHTDCAQDSVGQGLHTGELHAVHHGREVVYGQNLEGKDNGTGKEVQVAFLQMKVPLCHAEQIHAKSRQPYGGPDAQSNLFPQENPQQRHQHHIQRADEARFAHSGIPHAELLQSASQKQADAAADAAEKEQPVVLFPVSLPGLLFAAPVHDGRHGQQHHQGNDIPHRDKSERAHIVHAHALGHKSKAPYQGGCEQDQGLPQCGFVSHDF